MVLFASAVPWLSLVVSLPAMMTAQITAQFTDSIAVGGKAELELMARCRFPAPVFRCTVDVLRVPTGQRWNLKPGEGLPTEHCGQLLCVPQNCWVYDYLGLFRVKKKKCAPFSVLVMPLPQRAELPRALQQRMAQRWKPKPGGGFSEQHENRLYRPGDGLNQVHWKLTAKVGKLMIREAMEPVRQTLTLKLELRGDGRKTDLQMGRLLYLGASLTAKGYHFTVLALTGDGAREFAVRSEDDLQQAMEMLLCAVPAPQSLPLLEAGTGCFDLGGEPDEA